MRRKVRQISMGATIGAFAIHCCYASGEEFTSAIDQTDARKCSLICQKIVDYARTERSYEKINHKVAKLMSPITGIERNVYMVHLLADARPKYPSVNGNTDCVHHACQEAIYISAWWVACSDKPEAAEALQSIKQMWQPDGMSGLLFHKCELRLQHKTDGWL